jgi:hypothetical protein
VDSAGIFRGHEDNIISMAKGQTKTSGHDKAEAGVDSAGIFRGHEDNIISMAKGQTKASGHVKAEAGVDSTRIFRVEDRAYTAKVSEVKDHAARALNVRP